MIYFYIYLAGIPICLFGVYFVLLTHKSNIYFRWNEYYLTHFSAFLFAVFWPFSLTIALLAKIMA